MKLRQLFDRDRGLLGCALRARREYGKSLASQLAEILRLRLGPGKLAADEYYAYRLFDDARLDLQDKLAFGGWRLMEAIPARLNNPEWIANSQDKLFFYQVLERLSLPHPRLQALAWGRRRWTGERPLLDDAERLDAFFAEQARYPLFCKPVRGNHGRDALAIDARAPGGDGFLLGNGQSLSRSELYAMLLRPRGHGFLLQDRLPGCPRLAPVCGARLSSVRLNLTVDEQRMQVHRAVWKIPTGGNMIDNFEAGRTGNLAAALDPATGRVERVVAGSGFDQRLLERHPESGVELPGFALPQWPQVLELAQRAASIFVDLRWQGWDIALTADGPALLELNHISGLALPQHACGRGIYTADLRAFCDRRGSA